MKVTFGTAVCGAVIVLAACSSSHPASRVPSLHGSGPPSGPSLGTGPGRAGALHAAAQCIRVHGVPTYQDPVLTADGHVYTDARSIQNLGETSKRNAKGPNVKHPGARGSGGTGGGASGPSVLDVIRQACGPLLTAAGFQPDDEAPAPPALIQAGVEAARCLRAHGLPNYRDPTSTTPFTPGHGFVATTDELPNNGALGKQDPVVQRAFAACRPPLDAEITASDLQHLGHD